LRNHPRFDRHVRPPVHPRLSRLRPALRARVAGLSVSGGRVGKRPVTLKDVAARAGVGAITVSRALREPAAVSAALRARIEQAVAELGYVANHAASSMAAGHSRIVPVVVPTLAHPVYVPFLDGVNAVLDEQGYQVLLGTTEYRQDREARLVEGLLGWAPAGLLLAGVDHTPALRARLQALARTRPLVEFMDLDGEPIDLMVGFSHRAVGRAVADWFADRGFRHIAIVSTGAEHDLRAARRAKAFAETLAARGLRDDYVLDGQGPSSIAGGGQLLAELLQRHPQVQAVFLANDDLAAGALFEAQRRGLRVPQDLALMGFNDAPIAAAVLPALSSVAVDRRGMGHTVATLLLERLAGATPQSRVIDTGFSIVARASTDAPPRPTGDPT
jgi:LacI family gluconate utilization system Gnt-I transcriptional repressor